MSTTKTNTAQACHTEVVEALASWQQTNRQRLELGAQFQTLAEDERPEALAAYMQLCELEMVQGGAAILALSNCLTAFNAVCQERTGVPVLADLSAPDGT
jgi:hypothetical protein